MTEVWEAGADHLAIHVLSRPGQRAADALRTAAAEICSIRPPVSAS